MSTTGSLTDFSLPEIFQFIDKGHKTGLLRVRALSESQRTPPLVHYLWVYKGRLVAAANRSDQQGLVSLIAQRHRVSKPVVARLAQECPTEQPLGLFLKSQFVLETEQLKHLFQIQVLQQVCALFAIKEGHFKFEQNMSIPTQEMTGLSVPAGLLHQYCSIEVPFGEIESFRLDLASLPVCYR